MIYPDIICYLAFLRLINYFFDKRRRPHDLAVFIDTRMLRIALRQQCFTVFVINFIIEFDAGFDRWVDRRFNHQDFIVFCRGGVFAMGLCHGKKDPVVFDFFIGQSQESEHFAAADFKPAKIVAVIGLAHIVGITVYYTVCGAMTEHKGFPLE